jgi:proline iminopeptidase
MSGPSAVEGHIEVPGGRIWYRIVGPDRPGTPVLCLHGGPGMPHDYLEPLEDLAVTRPVVFYDQLGCGRSDRPADDSLWTTDRFVEELATVRAALGLERAQRTSRCWPRGSRMPGS